MTGRLRLISGILVLLTVTAGAAVEPHAARVAIIIDDLGYELIVGRRSIDLPGPVACAILPLTPRARRLAQAAYSSGKEVLLHLPLESGGDDDELEPGGIRLDMSRMELAAALGAGLDSVPHVVGVNNHRGSMLTRHPGHMRWLMEEIRERGNLFFIDSYTTHKSVALQLALESGVMATKRDVFLDPDRSPATVVREFGRLKELAKKNGAALGIGHPYPSTLALLEREIPKLPDEGIELIGIAELVSLRNSTAGSGTAKTGDRMR